MKPRDYVLEQVHHHETRPVPYRLGIHILCSVAPPLGYEWVDEGVYGNLRVIDVSGPAEPRQIAASEPLWAGLSDIAVAGRYAYIRYRACHLGACREGYTWLDVADPTRPQDVGDVGDQPEQVVGVGFGRGIAVADGEAHVAGRAGLEVRRVSPRGWARIGQTQGLGPVDRIAVSNGQVYITAVSTFLSDRQLSIVDAADPARPVVRGAIQVPQTCSDCLSLPGLAAAGGHVYLGLWEDGLQVVDVRDPGQARLRGHLDLDPTAREEIGDLTAAGRFMYPLVRQTVHVVDVQDPDHPRPVATLPLTWCTDPS